MFSCSVHGLLLLAAANGTDAGDDDTAEEEHPICNNSAPLEQTLVIPLIVCNKTSFNSAWLDVLHGANAALITESVHIHANELNEDENPNDASEHPGKASEWLHTVTECAESEENVESNTPNVEHSELSRDMVAIEVVSNAIPTGLGIPSI